MRPRRCLASGNWGRIAIGNRLHVGLDLILVCGVIEIHPKQRGPLQGEISANLAEIGKHQTRRPSLSEALLAHPVPARHRNDAGDFVLDFFRLVAAGVSGRPAGRASAAIGGGTRPQTYRPRPTQFRGRKWSGTRQNRPAANFASARRPISGHEFKWKEGFAAGQRCLGIDADQDARVLAGRRAGSRTGHVVGKFDLLDRQGHTLSAPRRARAHGVDFAVGHAHRTDHHQHVGHPGPGREGAEHRITPGLHGNEQAQAQVSTRPKFPPNATGSCSIASPAVAAEAAMLPPPRDPTAFRMHDRKRRQQQEADCHRRAADRRRPGVAGLVGHRHIEDQQRIQADQQT